MQHHVDVLAEHAEALASYRAGENHRLASFFVGRAMAASGARADPVVLQRVVRARIDAPGGGARPS